MGRNRVSPTKDQVNHRVIGFPKVGLRMLFSSRIRRLGVLVWKNSVLVRRRHWFITLLEILVPLVLFAIIAFLRANASSLGSVEVNESKRFDPKDQAELRSNLRLFEVFYAPKNSFTETLVNRAKEFGGLKGAEGFNSVEEMLYQHRLLSNKTDNYYLERKIACLVFEGDAATSTNGQVPKKLDYKIRIKDHFKTDQLIDSLAIGPSDYRSETYMQSGFIGIQLITNKAFIELAQSHELQRPPKYIGDQMLLQTMPYPPFTDDHGYSLAVKSMLPFVSMFSFIILCTTVTKRVVEEKQSGAKELMKLMGMEKWAFWAGWLIDALLIRVVTMILIVFLLTFAFDEASGAVLNESSPTLLFFMLMMYCASAVVFLFAISTFFSKPLIAMTVSFVVWFLSLVIPSQYVNSKNPGFFTKCIMMIFPNMGLFFTFDSVLELERRGAGAQWGNIHMSGTGTPRDISLLNVLCMYIIDLVLYAVITWYVSEVHPGQYGYKQPYFFFATRAYWLGERERTRTKYVGCTRDLWQIEDPAEVSQENYERPLTTDVTDDKVGIIIRNLRKTYPGLLGRPPVRAVRGISLDIYKGEITALLGHNGAGKTTTMSILTGMISPSDGKVQVLGYDLKHDLSEIRQSLGLCPQHNLLFGELTVQQHLVFFAMLKGNSMVQARGEAEELLSIVRLDSKKDALVSELSGGMKRKLQLAIALIGGSQVVMLDEPTSGLDPEARREIWDLLLHLRKQRTIVLSTHFMEEADVLGDTIAIMSHGNVECCGSTMYLKKVFGAGYHLNLLRKNNCNEKTLTKTLKDIIPEVIVENSSEDGTDSPKTGPITFTLPSNQVDKFPKLFDALEKSKDELGIASIGVSVTTMEEVFLKVGELSAKKYANENMGDFDITDNGNGASSVPQDSDTKISGANLIYEQIHALTVKKMIVSKRQWLYLLLQFLLPVLLTLCAVVLSYATMSIDLESEPELPISLSQYGSESTLRVLYERDTTDQAGFLSKIYAANLRGVAGVTEVDKLEDKLIEIGTKSLLEYRGNYIAAARITSVNETLRVNGLYSYDSWHSAPISLNLISNALLKYHASSAYEILTENQPLPVNTEGSHMNNYAAMSAAIAFIWLSLAHLGWIFATSVNMVLPLQERVLGARQLQIMAGCPLYVIWLSYFIIDAIITSTVTVVVLAVIFPFDTQHIFTSGTELGVLFSIFFLYGISGTMFAYFISFVKDSVPSAFGFTTFITLFIGGIVNVILYALEMFPMWEDYGSALRIIFGLLMPHSALISSLTHFSGTAIYNSMCRTIPDTVKDFACKGNSPLVMCCERICEQYDLCFKPASYMWGNKTVYDGNWAVRHGGIGQELIYFTIGSFLWIGIVLLLDSGVLNRISEKVLRKIDQRLHPRDEVDGSSDDQDVQEETNRVKRCIQSPSNAGEDQIDSIGSNQPILAVDTLHKQYGLPVTKGRFPAVRGVSFRVERGECFGLLGVNGAGKSTTFRMLTGAAPPTEGDALLGRSRLSGNRSHFLSGLGYCPQTDAQLGVLTGRETLKLYARLRGVPKEQVHGVVNKWLEALGLTEYANRPAGTYSGGNQRKLSAAMALIGEPPVALLDEPTSGVDPIARRQLWQALASCQRAGQSIVLTSHSMDECEALCSRLGIMVAGKLVCLGPIGHLKDKYGQGYTLMVKVKSLSWGTDHEAMSEGGRQLANLKIDIERELAPCTLLDEHLGLLHYQIKGGRKWSDMFKEMESLKKFHSIMEDYTLSETTLEQVFLSFAQQRDRSSQPPDTIAEITHV
ncbi:phospholipid-transporting ATPase ABCA1-like isoform X2 [Cloeon dipterum]|uniref:phospholipid-transporting ATPase ABCA1-like isoform X2 n=1 Tax=Cloeon dipterum TaxID=197152 RepID=UPI00321F616F